MSTPNGQSPQEHLTDIGPDAASLRPFLESGEQAGDQLHVWRTNAVANVAVAATVEQPRATRIYRMGRMIVKGVLKGALIGVGAASGVMGVMGGLVYAGLEIQERVNRCDEVDETYIDQAEALLRSPDNPVFQQAQTDIRDTIATNGGLETIEVEKANQLTLFAAQKEVAKANQLTVRSHWEQAADLEADAYGKDHIDAKKGTYDTTAIPTTTYMEKANAFLAPYNLSVRIANPADSLEYGFQAPSEAEQAGTIMKLSLLNVMRYASSQPVEYMQEGKTREYVLASGELIPNPDDPDSGMVRILGYNQGRTVVLNAKEIVRTDIIAHEDGHGRSDLECGKGNDVRYDPALEAYNGEYEYTEDALKTNGSLSYEGLSEDYDVRHLIQEHVKNPQGMQPTARQDIASVHFISNYAQSRPGEDKAETAAAVTSINTNTYQQILGLDCPLTDKFTYVVASGMSYSDTSKRSMHYFAAMNNRHTPVL